VYSGLLVIALLSQVVAGVLLYLDYNSYKTASPPKPPAISTTPPAPPPGGGGGPAQ
jgi:hypothetical protein